MNQLFTSYPDLPTKAIIGMVVQHPHLLEQCQELTVAHFTGRHQILWQEITEARAAGRAFDLILLSHHLETAYPLEGRELMLALTDCCCAVPVLPSMLPEYCRALITAKQRRDLCHRTSLLLESVSDPYADWREAFARFRELEFPEEKSDGLPPIVTAAELCANPPPLPQELIEGVLHRGAKLVLGGGSKSFKTWTLVDLAISIATGTDFWGYSCESGRVLYVNLEIAEHFFSQRVSEICRAKGLPGVPANLEVFNLRGYACDAAVLIPKLIKRAKQLGYALIIIDPIYKILGGRDENASRDMADLMNLLEKMAVQTGAAVAFGSHFAKGNASGKESIDRISGSGVFARDPDTILTMTRHEEQDAFTIEMTLRNHPPQEPFVVKHRHPLMVVTNLDPKKLKTMNGRKEEVGEDSVLNLLGDESLSYTEWYAKAETELLISVDTFKRRLRKLKANRRIRQSPLEEGKYVRA